MGRFEAEIAGLPLELTYSLSNMLEALPVGVHKGRSLTDLLKEAGSLDGEVEIADDGENDLTLFDVATLSFVPADNPPAIQARADRILEVRKEGLLAPILREIGRSGGM